MKIDQSRLSTLLRDHLEWLNTDGKLGRQLNLVDASLDHLDLSGSDLRYAILKGASLVRTVMNGVNLSFADLQGAKFDYARLENANFEKSRMSGASLRGVYAPYSNFTGATIERVSLTYSDCRYSFFCWSTLSDSALNNCNFTRCDFSDCNFYDNSTKGSIFTNAVIDESWINPAPEDEESKKEEMLIELKSSTDVLKLKLKENSLKSLARSQRSFHKWRSATEFGATYLALPIGIIALALGFVLWALRGAFPDLKRFAKIEFLYSYSETFMIFGVYVFIFIFTLLAIFTALERLRFGMIDRVVLEDGEEAV